jgi:glycosyltransferase involved in cell wall biosynthesis
MSVLPSIIIPTYNGVHRLQVTLPFLLSQSITPLEYIIVIDGSEDDTLDWISSQHLPDNCKVQFTSNAGRSGARNFGASLAQSDILLFVDDDIRVPYHFVERHSALQFLHPNSLISGDVRQDLNTHINFDICAFRDFCERKWISGIPSHCLFFGFHFTSQNLSVSKSTFHLLGGFDHRLTDSEDFLLGVLAVKNSTPIIFDPSLVSYHCDYGDLDYLIRRNSEYIVSKLMLADLSSEVKDSFSYVLSVPSAHNFFKNLARRLFVYNSCWRHLTHSPAFFHLPRSLRFKIYDYLLSSSVARRLNLI